MGLRSDPDSLVPDLVFLAVGCLCVGVWGWGLQDKIAYQGLKTYQDTRMADQEPTPGLQAMTQQEHPF